MIDAASHSLSPPTLIGPEPRREPEAPIGQESDEASPSPAPGAERGADQLELQGAAESPEERELTDEEKEQVRELQKRDQEVRTHEQAHVAAGGSLVRGGIHYEYQVGPDDKRYAVGGHVNIDTSEGRSPEETVEKARRIRRAALAPAEPSSADRAVAAKASQLEAKAQRELAMEESESSDESVAGQAHAARNDDRTEIQKRIANGDSYATGGLIDITA